MPSIYKAFGYLIQIFLAKHNTLLLWKAASSSLLHHHCPQACTGKEDINRCQIHWIFWLALKITMSLSGGSWAEFLLQAKYKPVANYLYRMHSEIERMSIQSDSWGMATATFSTKYKAHHIPNSVTDLNCSKLIPAWEHSERN